MGDYDDLPYIVIERHSGGLRAFLWGALIGAGAALLLAPRSGAKTQDDIRQGVRRVRTAAEDRVEAARTTITRARDRIEEQVDSIREQVNTVRDRIDTRTEQAREMVDGGRRVARDAREEIERRVSEARETYHSAAEKMGRGSDDPASGGGVGEIEVIVTDVAEERAEGRSDLG